MMKEKDYWLEYNKRQLEKEEPKKPDKKYLFKADNGEMVLAMCDMICKKLDIDTKPIWSRFEKTKREQVFTSLKENGFSDRDIEKAWKEMDKK